MSPDTHVFILLLTHQHLMNDLHNDVLFETGTGNTHRLLSVRKHAAALGHVTLALPGFHAFTGCDTTSAFLHKCKKWPLTIMKRTVDFIRAFTDLGPMQAGLTIRCCQCCKSLCSLRTRPTCQTSVGSAARCSVQNTTLVYHRPCCLTCGPMQSRLTIRCCQCCKSLCALCMYSSCNVSDVNEVRRMLFRARHNTGLPQTMLSPRASGIDLSLLPPCRRSLDMLNPALDKDQF